MPEVRSRLSFRPEVLNAFFGFIIHVTHTRTLTNTFFTHTINYIFSVSSFIENGRKF